MARIGSGAEAVIDQQDQVVHKIRPKKSYRHPVLDKRLRRSRTKREAKILQKCPVLSPQFISMNEEEMAIQMSFLDGPKVRDALNIKNTEEIATQIGNTVSRLHAAGIIHGDLTTSNMILVENQLHLIDFGLSFFSSQIEHQAVDLHLLKETLHATHPLLDIWPVVLNSYAPSAQLTDRFEQVERRGRYKNK